MVSQTFLFFEVLFVYFVCVDVRERAREGGAERERERENPNQALHSRSPARGLNP